MKDLKHEFRLYLFSKIIQLSIWVLPMGKTKESFLKWVLNSEDILMSKNDSKLD